MAVYGRGKGDGSRFHEDDQQAPIDPYGVAKYACEQDIQIAGEQHGLDWCIIRPHNVYGIKQNIWDKYRNVIGIWMLQAMNNKPLTVYGDGLQTRAFSFIDDCNLPLWKAGVDVRASKQIINVGGVRDYSILETAQLVQKITGAKDIIHMEERHEVKHAVPTYEKSIKLLDYEESTSLEQGIAEMWEWAKKQPQREQFIWNEYELDTGIYSFWRS